MFLRNLFSMILCLQPSNNNYTANRVFGCALANKAFAT